MARKVETVVITDENRDINKVFVITEMPASRAERWAMRALFLAARSGIDIGDVGETGAGMAGIAALGIQALLGGINFAEAEPLFDEMFSCIQIKPDPRNRPDVVRDLIEDDIEEIATRLKLRVEVVRLHLGFFAAGAPSTSTSSSPTPVASPNAPMSRTPSIR